jgi:hypothetical protein
MIDQNAHSEPPHVQRRAPLLRQNDPTGVDEGDPLIRYFSHDISQIPEVDQVPNLKRPVPAMVCFVWIFKFGSYVENVPIRGLRVCNALSRWGQEKNLDFRPFSYPVILEAGLDCWSSDLYEVTSESGF